MMRRGMVSVTVLLTIAMIVGMYAKLSAWKERSDAWMQFRDKALKERGDAGDAVAYRFLDFGRNILPAGEREVFQYRRGKLVEADESFWKKPPESWHWLLTEISRDLVHAELTKRGTWSDRTRQEIWKEPTWKTLYDILGVFNDLDSLVERIRSESTPSPEEDAATREKFAKAKERLWALLAQK